MTIDLTDTTTAQIQQALTQARHRLGGPTMGHGLTLVIGTDEATQYDAIRAAGQAAREHPCRVLGVIKRDARSRPARRRDPGRRERPGRDRTAAPLRTPWRTRRLRGYSAARARHPGGDLVAGKCAQRSRR